MLGCAALLGLLSACGGGRAAPVDGPVKSYPSSFSVPDPEFDAESTAADLTAPPNVDLTAISAAVGPDGIRATFSYAKGWNPDSTSRWGIRFEIKDSQGRRISGAWTQDPGSVSLTREVQLAPRPAGCTATVRFATTSRRLTLALGAGCLPRASTAEPRPWILFDTIQTVSSWHAGPRILYAWDQLYSRLVAPEPERLYLPH